jgi:folate-dependent phosphoribosylglycinamide formyltransferase PurN
MTPMTRVPLPSNATSSGLRVVVLTCGDLGLEVANTLSREAGVGAVFVLRSPWLRKSLTLRQKFRHVVRTQGVGGLLHVALSRVVREAPGGEPERIDRRIIVVDVDDYHSIAAREALRLLRPDLGLVVGTYILRDGVFDIPRYGSINLHSGKAPQYRGAAPAFWELYNGETEVGITIHRVAAELDAGDVLRQEAFALDAAPAEDPMEYIERYRREVLRPNGTRMLVDVVREIAAGRAQPCEQDHGVAKTYRSPTHKDVVELRSRVSQRRGAGVA